MSATNDAILDYIHKLAVENPGTSEDDILDVYLMLGEDPLEFVEYLVINRKGENQDV